MAIKGIDVSTWQGKIDWDKVKANGVKFAIIRCGYGMDQNDQDDEEYERNVKECERLGIPYGVYLFSYANSLVKADSEAQHTLRLIGNRKPTLGVWYDIEDNKTSGSISKQLLTDIINTYCSKIQQAGHRVGVYASLNWLDNKIERSVKDKYPIWVAQYYSRCQYTGKYIIWQYSSSGKVDGVNGNCDMNYLYDETWLSGTKQEEKHEEKKDDEETESDRIKALQRALNNDFNSRLDVDGIIGPLTTNAVMNHFLSNYTQGKFAKWTQEQLKRKGYDVGIYGIDGKYGGATEKAVKQFQKDNKLTVDGYVGIATVKMLSR